MLCLASWVLAFLGYAIAMQRVVDWWHADPLDRAVFGALGGVLAFFIAWLLC